MLACRPSWWRALVSPRSHRGGWRLSSTWTHLAGRALVNSMATKVVVRDESIREILPMRPVRRANARSRSAS